MHRRIIQVYFVLLRGDNTSVGNKKRGEERMTMMQVYIKIVCFRLRKPPYRAPLTGAEAMQVRAEKWTSPRDINK